MVPLNKISGRYTITIRTEFKSIVLTINNNCFAVQKTTVDTAYCHKATEKSNDPLAIPSMEGTHLLLNDSYVTRTDKVDKCARVTMSRGYTFFALLEGRCLSAFNAESTYTKYGSVYKHPSSCPPEGLGNEMAIHKLSVGRYC